MLDLRKYTRVSKSKENSFLATYSLEEIKSSCGDRDIIIDPTNEKKRFFVCGNIVGYVEKTTFQLLKAGASTGTLVISEVNFEGNEEFPTPFEGLMLHQEHIREGAIVL